MPGTLTNSEAVMLAKVLCPGAHDKCFEVAVCVLKVPANSPSGRAVAASDASVLMHGPDKLRYLLRIHVIFNRNKDRAAGTGIGIHDSRQAPMIPWRQIRAYVRHAPKEA
jgi:hypothetical protein